MITLVLILIFGAYLIAISLLIYGFTKIKNTAINDLKPNTAFTIIVPFRNEVENLPILLDRLSQLNYPINLFQVILVNDNSTDGFQAPSFEFKISVINNNRVSKSPKKDAILTAMNTVTTDWIITTDADCVVNKNWLLTLDNYIQSHDVDMIAGAVTYNYKSSFLHHFQQLDITSLQGATIGSFGINKGFMCNGANLAYTKSLFQQLNGFEGNDKIASGDDVFLLQKALIAFPKKVHYLKSKSNIVVTKPLDNWKSLFYQRVRWASKTTSYKSTFGKALGLIVFTGNLGWIFTLGYWFFNFENNFFLLLIMVLKIVIDVILILQSNQFLNTKKISYLLLSSLFYPFFSVSVALYSLFGKYEWKGRQFKK